MGKAIKVKQEKSIKAEPEVSEEQDHVSACVFVRNIPQSVDEEILSNHFGGIGPLRAVTLTRDKDTGESKRCAFVRYALVDHAKFAIKTLNGCSLSGASLNLSYAIPRNRGNGKTSKEEQGERKKLNKNKNKAIINASEFQKGAIRKRTVIIKHIEEKVMTSELLKREFDNINPSSLNNNDNDKSRPLIPEHIVLSADGKIARAIFNNWSLAGKAAARLHSKGQYRTVIDAFQSQYVKPSVIIRNLPYTVTESEIKEGLKNIMFRELRIVRKEGSNNCAGFAFVEFFTAADAGFAIEQINGKEIGGRIVAVDHAVEKNVHKKKTQNAHEAEEEDDKGDEKVEINDFQSQDAKSTVVIRNLPYKVTESEIKEALKNILFKELRIMRKKGSTDCAGFAFVDLFTAADTRLAIEQINGKKIGGRKVAVGHAVEKRVSEKKTENADEGDEEDDERDEKIESIAKLEKNNSNSKKHSTPEELERTVFVGNLLYECTGSEVWKAMQDVFGKVEQAVIVKHHATGLSRGSAFVRFACKESALKALESDQADDDKNGEIEEEKKGLLIRGRKVFVRQAVDRSRVHEVKESNVNVDDKKSDPRNLRLANVGKVERDSEEGKQMTPEDWIRRENAENQKKHKLSNNPNSFISDVRLCVRNLPKKGVNKRELRGMFEMAGRIESENGKGWSGGKVVHCTIVSEKETGKTKGYGFVQFEKHEDAMRALKKLNNTTDALDILVKWMKSQQRRKELMQHSKNKKKNQTPNQNKVKELDEVSSLDFDDEVNELKENWGNRRLIVEFSVEDWRTVRALERIKQKGAQLKEERRNPNEDGAANPKGGKFKKNNTKRARSNLAANDSKPDQKQFGTNQKKFRKA